MEAAADSENWTRRVIMDEVISNLEWGEGIYGVQVLEDSPHEPFDTLIRIKPWPEYGDIVRFALKTRFTPEQAEAFDKRFEDDDTSDATCSIPDTPAPVSVVIPYPPTPSLGGVTS